MSGGAEQGSRVLSRYVFAGAERSPDKLAIACNGRRLSYSELARAIEAMIQALEAHIAPGPGYAVVAIAGLLDFWVISLALRELGLTTVPTMSAENVAGLQLSQLRMVVADPEPAWPGLGPVCQRLGRPLLRVQWNGALARPIEAGRQRTSDVGGHVLQTSATTGLYKKVLMAPSFEQAFMELRRAQDNVAADTKCALFNFGGWTGAGYKTTGGIWLAGGAVILEQRSELHLCLAEPGLTHAVVLPDQLHQVLAAPPGAIRRQPELRLDIGGATPRQAQVDLVRDRLTAEIISSLGCTEAHTFAETRLETPEDRRWHRLLPHRDPQVVDDDDRPAPMGVVGRLRVSTRQGPTSYLEDPDATAAFFKDGWFYPGDLAVMRADGRLALMGRTTDVINIMGQKVSPAPYEDELCERLGVSGACLFSRQNADADEEIHVVLETPEPLQIDRLTAVLRETLAGFPAAEVHYVRRLPRNLNGKLLRSETQRRLVGAAAGQA